jgi:calcineurin-like phosphoesterase family protein
MTKETNIYFTSDCHFNHANIIIYTHRPFLKEGDLIPNTNFWMSDDIRNARCNDMNETIIKRWNEKVCKNDIVYHLGDFSFKRLTEPKYWEDKLNGRIVHICGNHDNNNGVKTLIQSAIMEFGNKVFLTQHIPPTMIQEIPDFVDAVLCGHMHDKWKHQFIEDVPIINVGVDVWDFTPVSISSILKYLDKMKNMVE